MITKFYKCSHCGNVLLSLKDSGVTPACCGESMELLDPNTTDAAQEKHVPVIEKDGAKVTVKVGSVAHPMLDEHFIQFIVLEQGGLIQKFALSPGEEPQAVFVVADAGAPVTAYEYCNLHGLWKATA